MPGAFRLLSAFPVLLLLFSFFSCTGNAKIGAIDFPPTYIVEEKNRFAVVTRPYAVLLDQPSEQGVTVSHCRRGDVFAVTGSRFVESGDTRMLWVSLEGGWIPRGSVSLFSGRARAENAAAALVSSPVSGD